MPEVQQPDHRSSEQLQKRVEKDMSRYISAKYGGLEPYTPGEQPQDMKYVKLNTNESPFPPSPKALEAARMALERLQLYPDPECKDLVKAAAPVYGISEDEILFSNGSDEILDFAFMAFCDDRHPAAFPDVTYGFYPVYAQLHHIPYTQIALEKDFSINIDNYKGRKETIFIANPNAPTGIALSASQIEEIVINNPDNVVVVDEAYVDFGAQSCVPLIHKYDNLLIIQTFSKSRSMAGARLGFAIGDRNLIDDLKKIKYSINPYNVNSVTMAAAGAGAFADEEYRIANCKIIMENRAYTCRELKKMGFSMTDSLANFIFVTHPQIPGEELYLKLKEKGVLVRHFKHKRLCEYNRITIGSREQMDILLQKIGELL